MTEYNLSPSATTRPTPYQSGLPVDKVPIQKVPKHVLHEAEQTLRSMAGSFNWLAMATRPDIATITNLLAHHLHTTMPSHVKAAKYVLCYLIGIIDLGIKFSPLADPTADAFVKFPLDQHKTTSLIDANWGPQDHSLPDPLNPSHLDLFKSRYLSGFLI